MTGSTQRTSDRGGGEDVCPVFNDPDRDCYCLNLNSQNIPKAVQFCLRDFRKCPIYKHYLESHDS